MVTETEGNNRKVCPELACYLYTGAGGIVLITSVCYANSNDLGKSF